jgi:hypothetical protein
MSDAQYECELMKLPKCPNQDISRRLDMSICQACIAGRSERHLFEIKGLLSKLLAQLSRPTNG